MKQYHQQLAMLRGNGSPDDAIRQHQISQLRQQYFSGSELVRIDAIDRQ
ncbi:MAG: hypothetical protein HRT35_15945 [Algicola sp.]|nr:hypothetical protein [Algicola sp.]